MPNIKLIAAVDSKLGIAKAGRIPWDLPADRKYFRDLIINGPVVMGMNTYVANNYQRFGRGKNIIITRYRDNRLQGVNIVNHAAGYFSGVQEDIWVVGGGQIFKEALPYATHLYLTRVEGDFGCDVFFPEFEGLFMLTRESQPQTENNIVFKYQIWARQV